MPNSDLKDKIYKVPSEHQKCLGSTTISYHNLKMKKSRMESAKKDDKMSDFNKWGGENVLKWINDTLKKDRDSIYNEKKIGMDTGRENQFIKTHDKDKDNANPTGVGGIPKFNKGSVHRKIMSGKEVYNESINKEILEIKYLIEYLNKK